MRNNKNYPNSFKVLFNDRILEIKKDKNGRFYILMNPIMELFNLKPKLFIKSNKKKITIYKLSIKNRIIYKIGPKKNSRLFFEFGLALMLAAKMNISLYFALLDGYSQFILNQNYTLQLSLALAELKIKSLGDSLVLTNLGNGFCICYVVEFKKNQLKWRVSYRTNFKKFYKHQIPADQPVKFSIFARKVALKKLDHYLALKLKSKNRETTIQLFDLQNLIINYLKDNNYDYLVFCMKDVLSWDIITKKT